MRITLIAVLIVLACGPAPALAQIYRWTDDQGGVHYTEGIASVPEQYRSGARAIATPPPPPPPAAAPPTPSPPVVPRALRPPSPAPAAPAPSTPPPERTDPVGPSGPRSVTPSPGQERYRATTSTAPRLVRVVYPPAQLKAPTEITDYPDAVALALFALQRSIGLPPVSAVDVLICPNPAMVEAAMLEMRYLPMFAHDVARAAAAIATGPDRMIINESAMVGRTRESMLRLLAHEVAHVVQSAQSWTRIDQWFVEGFAEWASYRAVHWLGLNDYALLRQINLRSIGRASDRPLPRLADLGRSGQWVLAHGSAGGAGTYSQGFLAVEYLIQEKGFETVIGYFRASATSTDRLQTFRQAFGEDFEQFEVRFASHLRALLP